MKFQPPGALFRSAPLAQIMLAGASAAEGAPSGITRALRAIRTHLGMDVAFVSEFVEGERVFRHVDSATPSPVKVGASDPLDQTYCQRVVDGRLPELIRDASEEPEAASLSVTADLPVGAHLSVPIRLKDGEVYGTFCCFSFRPDRSLTDRDLAMLRVLADLTAHQLDDESEARRRDLVAMKRLNAVMAGQEFAVALQPIVELPRSAVVGWEALARFPEGSPDVWFAEAARLGRAVDLDLEVVSTTLAALHTLTEESFIALNVGPETVTSGRLHSALAGVDLERVVVEMTEHAAVESYEVIAAAIGPLRRAGLRLAVDDAGAGYASFRHILQLAPDLIKLDMSLTRAVDRDPARRALATALIRFARDTGSTVIAEGIETAGELTALRDLGVTLAQGYHLGRPRIWVDGRRGCLVEKELLPTFAARSDL